MLCSGIASVYGLCRDVARRLSRIPRVFDLIPTRSQTGRVRDITLSEVCERVEPNTDRFEKLLGYHCITAGIGNSVVDIAVRFVAGRPGV